MTDPAATATHCPACNRKLEWTTSRSGNASWREPLYRTTGGDKCGNCAGYSTSVAAQLRKLEQKRKRAARA